MAPGVLAAKPRDDFVAAGDIVKETASTLADLMTNVPLIVVDLPPLERARASA